MQYHRMLARIFTLSTLLHLLAAIDRVGSFQNALDWDANNVHGVYGFLAFIATLGIGLTAIEPVRRKLWELFYFSHVMLVPLVFLFTLLHVRKKTAQVIMLVPISMYILDCLIRGLLILSRRSSAKSATAKSMGKLATKIEIDMKFPCGFEAGQYCWLNIPEISLLEWHPFTIASSPSSNKIVFYCGDIHKEGSFTNRLRIASKSEKLTVNVDGPHGKLGLNLSTYENVLLIAGGMGITPMISIFCDLAERKKRGEYSNLKQCTLVFSSKTSEQLMWFMDQYRECESVDGFNVELYATRNRDTESSSGRIHSGRANIESIVSVFGHGGKSLELTETLSEDTKLSTSRSSSSTKPENVAVLACGPERLVNSAHSAAWKAGYSTGMLFLYLW